MLAQYKHRVKACLESSPFLSVERSRGRIEERCRVEGAGRSVAVAAWLRGGNWNDIGLKR